MGRMYTVQSENVATTVAADLFELTPADDKPIAIHAIFVSQSTETGDAAEEMIRVSLIRGHTTSGSGGTAPTPVPLNPNDTAAGFTAEVNNTTAASVGTTTTLHSESFNVRTGWVYLPTPEMRPICSQANTTIVLRMMAAPADSVSFSLTVYIEELA